MKQYVVVRLTSLSVVIELVDSFSGRRLRRIGSLCTSVQGLIKFRMVTVRVSTPAAGLKPNSTTLSGRRQVRSRFEAGRRPAAS